MEGHQLASTSSQHLPLAIGLDGPALLSNFMSSVASDSENSGLNLIDIPLTLSALNGFQPNISLTSQDDSLTSTSALGFNGLSDAGMYKMSDNSFLNTVDTLSKNEAKSPLNIMVVSDGIQAQGQPSPAVASQANAPNLHYQSVVSGGDKMLSAVNSLNFNDPEMLGDAAFDSNTATSLPQFDDGLLSGLGSAGQGMRLGDGPGSSSFDLFDGSVADSLSLSPQPFSDAGLIPDSSSSMLDTGLLQQQSSDTILDSSSKRPGQGKKGVGSPGLSTDMSPQSKSGPSQCPTCAKTFNNIGALAKHRLTHSDERKYVCNVCTKGFKRQDHLNGHLMTHLDKKPYECQLINCDKGYCDARSLRRHLEQHHHLDPETIQTHVQASMAAAGISPPTPRNGGKSRSEKGDGRSKHLGSPVYSPGSATPTPSPGVAGGQNVFHFDTQQLKASQQQKQQQQQQQEVFVQQIHEQQKLLLQQQKQQKQQEEAKLKESTTKTHGSDLITQQLQLQLQLHHQEPQQQKSQPQQQQQQPSQAQSSGDMLAVLQQVQQLQQQLQQQQQLEVQKKKAEAEKESAAAAAKQEAMAYQDTVYTFVGTPTSSEHSPASHSDQSPSAVVITSDLSSISPVSPVTVQPISPMTTQAARAIWYTNSPETAGAKPVREETPKTQAYCSTCDRYFKNAAALNGHMRCHGGFLKKGKEKDNKKPPVRKSSSSSDMGPPLRRPPHTSTPSPQPAAARTSPSSSAPFSPTPLAPLNSTPVLSPTNSNSAIDVMSVVPTADQHVQNPQQKRKQLQEHLSSHLLKRRISGEQQQKQQQRQQQHSDVSSNHEQIRLLEEHIKAQQQQQREQQNIQSIQLVQGQMLGSPQDVAVPVNVDSSQGEEQIQKLVQSFQQVEELHRQQQQLPHLSAEQLEQIRQQHKLVGLPPLNPKQLQFQLQEQQSQILQAQLREEQLQEEQHQQLQAVESGTLVMSTSPIMQQGLVQVNNQQVATSTVPTLSGQQTLVQLNGQVGEVTDGRSFIPSQSALNTSVQHILATLDPSVVTAAGINLSDQQQLLAQLQKQQQQQSQQEEFLGIQIQPSLAGSVMGTGQPATLMAGLQVSQIPQILLQPPDSDDMNGVPTISIPESVVLGGESSSALQPSSMETEQEEIERIQNGLIASVVEKQQQDSVVAAFGNSDINHSLSGGLLCAGDMEVVPPNFLGTEESSGIGVNPQPDLSGAESQFGPLREMNITQSSSSIQQDPPSFNGLTSSSAASQSSSPSTSSAIARNTDAAVAQILRNISNSMAESSNFGLSSDASNSNRGMSDLTSLDSSGDRPPSYQSLHSFSSKPFMDSIKQDVMLSSAVNSNFDTNNLSSLSYDSLTRDDVPYTPKATKPHNGQESKRRMSADLESQRKASSISNTSKGSALGQNPHSMLVNPLEVEGIATGKIRMRSKSGDINYKIIRSKSVDHSPMRPRSLTEESLYRSNQQFDETFIKDSKMHHGDHDLFSRSDGAGVFRNPSTLPSPLKIKRKHRPAPLYIPPQFGMFQSRLRSPRVISKDGHLSVERGKGHTPPPYTPPPMLSPFRSGSGLFCTLQSSQPLTPSSAPVSGKIPIRSGSIGHGKDSAQTIFADQLPEEEAPPSAPEAHINVGPEYQAALPEFRDKSMLSIHTQTNDSASLLWDPSSEGNNTDEHLQCYQEFSCSAAVRGNGCNVEYALHLLHLAKGDVNEAMLMLMADPPVLPKGHPMLDYKYQETDAWNSNEMERFYKAIMLNDKDFFKVSKEVATKSVKQCVQFYYVWKKVCPDDYKRLRHSRNKPNDYNTRRQAEKAAATAAAEKAAMAVAQAHVQGNLSGTVPEEGPDSVDSDNPSLGSDNEDAEMASDSLPGTAPSTANSTPTRVDSPASLPPPVFACTHDGCTVTCSSKQSLKRHMRKHLEKTQATSNASAAPRKPRPSTPSRSPVYDESGEEIFPCRLCGRVFAKVKSRSAHMKSHKIAESAQQEKKAAEFSAATAAAFGTS